MGLFWVFANRVTNELLLSTAHASEKESDRNYLLKVAQTVQYLARQGLPLCGDGNEIDSNVSSFYFFVQIMIYQDT